MKLSLGSRISRAALLFSVGALGGCALHDDARLGHQSSPGSKGESYLAFAAGSTGAPTSGAMTAGLDRNPQVPPRSGGKHKRHAIGDKDPEFERKLAAIRSNPEARDALALRGGFIIPMIAVLAVIAGILAATNNDNKMAADAVQNAQSTMSLQTSTGLPGEDRDNVMAEQMGHVLNEAVTGHPR